MAIVVETVCGQDLDLGIGTTVKTHPAGGTLTGNQINIGTFSTSGAKAVSTTKTWAPASPLASGSQVTTTITVAGATTTGLHKVLASFSGMASLNLMISAHVSAASTVTVILANLSGSPITIPSGTLSVLVFRHSIA